jgi:hypothetical protein
MALVSEVAPRANKKYAVALPGPVRLPPSAVESPFSQVIILWHCYFVFLNTILILFGYNMHQSM